uniref:Fibrinogen C-terminal domain-containing protein n=1 Tax=Ciona savignyi TaxID=51511 RepID=H2Z1Z0_CIOSA
DCTTSSLSGSVAGAVFPIWLIKGYRFIYIKCDMSTVSNHGGKHGYMTFQQRINGKINFLREWESYVNGFGNPNGEYWAGLENILLMTRQSSYELGYGYSLKRPTLRIDMEGWDGFRAYGVYEQFSLYAGRFNYQVTNLGKRTGNAVELGYSDPLYGEEFTTFDHINEGRTFYWDCPQPTNGGWWFSMCSYANLNGRYPGPLETMSVDNIYWRYW